MLDVCYASVVAGMWQLTKTDTNTNTNTNTSTNSNTNANTNTNTDTHHFVTRLLRAVGSG